MYDPLNKVVVDACLAPAKAYEVNLALKHLEHTQANDLILFDRNYAEDIFLASMVKFNRQFAGRCSKSSGVPAQQLFKQHFIDSKKVTLTAKGEVKKTSSPWGSQRQ
jgi:hypothetical protein